MEIGRGEGGTERAGDVLGWFFMEGEEGADEKKAWVKEDSMETRVEFLVG